MKSTYKVVAIIAIIIGGFAIFDSLSTEDFYSFIGGVMFAGMGWIILDLLKK